MYASLFLFVSDNDVSDIYQGVGMAWLLKAGAFAAAAGIAMVNIDWFRKEIPQATLAYLSNIELRTLDGSEKSFLAADLWRKSGAVIVVVRRPG